MARKLPFVAVFLMLFAGLANAQASDPAWLDDMTYQLLVEKECEVSYLMNMREGELGGKPVFEARIQCSDGRMFDVSRIGRNADFVFKACDVQVC